MDTVLDKISDYIDMQRDNIVHDWIELVKIPSVKAEREGIFPFGKNVDDVLNAVTLLFNQNGFEMKKNTESGYALCSNKGKSDKTIGIFAHGDVVPVNEDEWTITKPFEPVIINGYVVGRGCRDNKNGIIASLYAMKALGDVGKELDNSVMIFVGGNEEAGMKDIEAFVRDEKIPDVSLVPDNSFPYSKGEWGIVKLICKSRKPFESICGFEGGEAYNIVLDSLKIAVKYDEKTAEELKTHGIEFYEENGNLCFSEKGISGHVAHPEGTVNAALVASEKLLNVKSICENDRQILRSLNKFISSPYGEGLNVNKTDEYGKTTVGNGIVRLDNGHLNFSLDVRFSPATDKDDVIEKLKAALAEQGFDMDLTGASNGFILEDNEKLTNAFLRSIKRFGADADSEPYIGTGLTYARHLKNAYSFGASLNWEPELIGIEPGMGKAHQTHEAASIDGLLQCIKILASMIIDADSVI